MSYLDTFLGWLYLGVTKFLRCLSSNKGVCVLGLCGFDLEIWYYLWVGPAKCGHKVKLRLEK